LGDNGTLSTGAGSYGRASIEQRSGWVYITLSYGVRVMKASTIETNEGIRVNNVDIWIIRINITKSSTNIGEFDLKAKCLNVTTTACADDGDGYSVPEDRQCNIAVGLGKDTSNTVIQLDGDKVVFNFVVAMVQVSV